MAAKDMLVKPLTGNSSRMVWIQTFWISTVSGWTWQPRHTKTLPAFFWDVNYWGTGDQRPFGEGIRKMVNIWLLDQENESQNSRLSRPFLTQRTQRYKIMRVGSFWDPVWPSTIGLETRDLWRCLATWHCAPGSRYGTGVNMGVQPINR